MAPSLRENTGARWRRPAMWSRMATKTSFFPFGLPSSMRLPTCIGVSGVSRCRNKASSALRCFIVGPIYRKISNMEPLRIGVSARLLYPDPARTFLPTKSVQYLEQSVANWVMSGDVLAFMIPEMSLATPHAPSSLKIKHYVDSLDGLLLQGGADMSP